MADLISAGLLGKSIWWVCDHASGGALSTFQQTVFERMRFPRQARSNHDLQKALQDAFPIAIESMIRSSSGDQQAYLGQIREQGSALLRDPLGDFPNRLLDALLYEVAGSNAWQAIWSPLEALLDGTETRPYFKASRRALEHRLQESFANVLRTDKHRRAVVAYQQAMFGEVVGALRDDGRALPEQIATIEVLQSVPDVVDLATQTVLAAVHVRDQDEMKHRDQLATQLNDMVGALKSIRNQIMGAFVLPNDQVLPTHLQVTCERVRSNLTRRKLVGREGDLQRLSDCMGEPAYVAVSGVVGAGKSSLLAHWIDRLREQDCSIRVCSHFFNLTWDTDRLGGGMACIAEQLLARHHISAQVSEAQPERLKVIVSTLLSMPHIEPLIVVLDGLDEITQPESLGRFALGPSWFPEALGENVHVVFGVRFGPGLEDFNALRCKLDLPWIIPFELDNLELEAVRELLSEPRKGLAEAIHQRTNGLANYVVAVVDEVNVAESNEAAMVQIDHLPERFSDYVNDGLDDATVMHREWLDPLGFLAAARGPLTRNELLRLCAMSKVQLVERDLRRPPWAIARWLTEADNAWSFQHLAIAEARRDGMTIELGSFRKRLLDDCADWETHRGPYSLIHYADDLLGMVMDGTSADGQYADLQTLALNPTYREFQRMLIPQRPGLPLQTIHAAMRANRDSVDIVQLTRLMLLHLDLLVAHRIESLLQVAADGNYERAMWLASLEGPHQAALSHLLIGWREADSHHPERLEAAIDRVALSPPVKLSGWQALALVTVGSTNTINSNPRALAVCCSLLNDVDLISLSSVLATRGLFDKAITAVTEIIDPNFRDEAVASVAKQFAARGQLDEALSIAGTPTLPMSHAWALANVAEGLGISGQLIAARDILDKVLAVAANIPDSSHRASSKAGVAHLLGTIGQHDDARDLLNQAKSIADTLHDSWEQSMLLTNIAKGYTTIGQHDDARDLLNQAKSIADTLSRPWQQRSAVANIAEILAANYQLDEALTAVSSLVEPWRQGIALAAIAQNFADAGQFDLARIVIANFSEDWSHAEYRIRALVGVAERLSDEGSLSEAQAAFDSARSVATGIAHPWERAMAMTRIAQGLAAVSQLDEARVMLDEARSFAAALSGVEVQALAIASIGRSLADNGQPDEARIMLGEAQAVAANMPGTWSRIGVLIRISQVFAAMGQFDEALAVVGTIADIEDRFRALKDIVPDLIEKGLFHEARVMLDEARSIIAELSGVEVQAEALAAIGRGFADNGQPDEARIMLGEAQAVAAGIPDTWQKVAALTQIAQVLAVMGQLDEASAVVDTIADIEYRFQALNSVAQVLATMGKLVEARNFVDQARAVAATLPEPRQLANALSRITETLTSLGQIDEAKSTLGEARVVAATLPGLAEIWDESSELADIARHLAENNRIDESWAIARNIPENWDRESALAVVAKFLATNGRFDEAHTVSTTIFDNKRRANALASIAIAELDHQSLGLVDTLISCAYFAESTWEVIAEFARLKPELAAAIGRIARGVQPNHTCN